MTQQFDEITATMMSYLTSYGMNVLGAIVTLIFGYILAGWLSRLTDRAMGSAEKIDKVFHPLPGKIVRVAVLVLTVIAVLNRFGVETTSLIALLGAAGLAIGLALQGTLSNVAAGVMILLFRPFKIGDVVKLSGEMYVIDYIGFFICKAHLVDGPSVFLPNSSIWGNVIINISVTENDLRRIDATYSIAYSDNMDTALGILNQIAADEPRIVKDPAPLIKVEELGESSVNILFRVWTPRKDWLATKLDLVKQCKEGLERGGCTIPFPQRDVHLYRDVVENAK